MSNRRCPLHNNCNGKWSRRAFLRSSAGVIAAPALLAGCSSAVKGPASAQRPIAACGPASRYTPRIRAAFVRRKGEYGMWWPGAVYDGQAARRMYSEHLSKTAKKLRAGLELRSEPIYSLAEGQAWIAEAEADKVDGLFLVMLDRQQHSWPTARKVSESVLPAVIFSPLGTSFTTNTAGLAGKEGCVVYATNDLAQATYGLKMLSAAAKIRRSRCVVIRGNRRQEAPLAELGITLQYVPAQTFVDEYNRVGETDAILAMADDYIRRAQAMKNCTRQDVINGVRSYYVAGRILKAEQADAITMDCLGALGNIKVSLPCIAWSRMNDDGIPAACEADLGAVASHIIVQQLFDRPGFQQDPVADTSDDTIIGAHCSCPTRLRGFGTASEPFYLMHHHGMRDAVPRTLWRIGQRVTSVDVLPGRANEKTAVLISAGTVVDNMAVPPSGGCVVSVKVKFDGDQNVLTFPGFHQVFFYGDYKDELVDFCQLMGLEAKVV